MTSQDFLARIEELKKSSDEGLQGELTGMREMLEQIEKDIKNKNYCKNCRFACQASDCECICHNGWINKEELIDILQTYAEALK